MNRLDFQAVEGDCFIYEPSANELARGILQRSGGTIPRELQDQFAGLLAEAAHEGMSFMYALVEAGIIEVPDVVIEQRIINAELVAYTQGRFDGETSIYE